MQNFSQGAAEVKRRVCGKRLLAAHGVGLEEAVYLSDRVFVMGLNPGRIKECIAVPFARPRLSGIQHDRGVLELQARVLKSIREETSRAEFE